MSGIFTKAKNWYTRYERRIASFSLVGGFVFDVLTIRGIDLFFENAWIVIRLIIVMVCIVVINRQENNKQEGEGRGKLHFWMITTLQFMFGGLLSTFLVFYFRSTTLAVTWPFILVLGLAFFANESFKQHYARLVFQISILYVSFFSFLIFIVPIFMHRIGADIFVLSGLLSLVLIAIFLFGLKKYAREKFKQSKKILIGVILGIFGIINILYFSHLIPPIPLALKDRGIYHVVTKHANFVYTVSKEIPKWTDYFSVYKEISIVRGAPVYAYSAIFSPATFQTGIVHEWQLRDEVAGKWVTMSRISLSASGGRADGYRTYSKKSAVVPGKWRVNVETKDGQIIGRIGFVVHIVDTEPVLIIEVK